MSTQKGNSSRNRPQKHQNRTAFKNSLHDTSHRTKQINSTQVSDVCLRCKEIIEWKIKYKKYKPLTQPRSCVKCHQKTVKKAYHVMCRECGNNLKVCTKCCESKEVVAVRPSDKEQLQLDNEMKNLLQSLPERKRRTFLRYMDKKNEEKKDEPERDEEKERDDLRSKLNALKIEEEDEGDFYCDEEENDFD